MKLTEEHIKELKEDAYIYKNINESQVANIKAIRQALDIVKNFIIKNNLIVYGGMAIDLALKNFTGKGIYTDDILPDYDFFSYNNITMSMLLTDELNTLLGSNAIKIKPINARHLITRRIALNKSHMVADLSYFPVEYYEKIPTLKTREGLNYVHPYFQKIDFYRSLAFLYEGTPGREYFRNRLEKDITRIKLINDIYCKKPALESDNKTQQWSKKTIDNLFIKDITDYKAVGPEFLVSQLSHTRKIYKLAPGRCYTGFAALAVILSIFNIKKSLVEYKNGEVTIPSKLEYFDDSINIDIKGKYYEKTMDIYPQAVIHNDEVIYASYGERFAAVPYKDFMITSIYYLAAQFIFRFIFANDMNSWEAFNICEDIINEKITFDKPKTIPEDTWPITINHHYYGREYIDKTLYYSEKKEKCEEEGETTNYRYETKYKFQNNKPAKISRIITYKVNGIEKDSLEKKSFDCD